MIPDELVIGFARRYMKPLAWPVIETVRWFRQRKLVKTLEREVKEAAEAAAAAGRARRASTAQADDDDDDELDEERRVRRMRWRRGTHYRDRVQALQQQIEKHRVPKHPQRTADTITAVSPGFLSDARASTDGMATVTVESNGQVSHTSMLEHLPKRLVWESGKGAQVVGGFHVHPDTPPDDPVLAVREETSMRTCPPSQDPKLLGHMGFHTRKSVG